jgi:hypothetical protein
MRLLRSKKRRPRLGGAGMELAGALSIASQMALLYPPGCDEWIRREPAATRKRLGAVVDIRQAKH